MVNLRKAIGLLLRMFSYLYHLILCVFLLGIAGIAWSAGTPLDLGMLPWKGQPLTEALVGLSFLGLLTLALAITGMFRWLFPLWTLLVVILLVRGFFLSPYVFPGPDEFKNAIWLTLGAILAFLGSLTLFAVKRRR